MDSKEVLQYLAQLERQLIKAYGSTYATVIEIAEVRRAIENGESFKWSDNKAATAKVDKLLKKLIEKVRTLIANGIMASYNNGAKNIDGMLVKALGIRQTKQKQVVTEICKAATAKQRELGMTASARLNARRGGIQASAAIWQQNAKKELEIIIQNGISEGKSPKAIASSIRGYLLEPNRYEQSVLNKETGKLERSEAAKNYHPGQGVYRSSYKNALRMARTEMTEAYRAAEWESYQNNPLIKAYEIRLSGNHTTKKIVKGKSTVVPLTDICDKLTGVYPKSFKWTGWHPQCRCVMIPITCSQKEFRELLEARKKDREDKKQGKEAKAVKKLEQQAANKPLPKQFTDWIKDNQARIDLAKKKGGSIPVWITDNYPSNTPTPVQLTPLQIAAQRHAERTQETIDAIIRAWEDRKTRNENVIPIELRKNGTYLATTEDGFSPDFFRLIDPNKPIKLIIENNDKGSYSTFNGSEVVIRSFKRGKNSLWFHRKIMYHEYGHAIDAQRGLWKDKELVDMRTRHIKYLNKKDNYTYWERVYDYSLGKYIWKKTTTKISKVAYIDKKLAELSARFWNMKNTNKVGVYGNKHDIMEQILSTRDTIKSLVVKYGEGHSQSYFRQPRNKETEYLAHAFENAFIGNKVFKKYLPEIYEEMVNYIKSLKPMQ